MANLELVALIVRDYDSAIRFFVDVFQFELLEDTPRLRTMDGLNAGLSLDRPERKQASCLPAPTANTKLPSWVSSSQAALASSYGSKTSTHLTNEW